MDDEEPRFQRALHALIEGRYDSLDWASGDLQFLDGMRLEFGRPDLDSRDTLWGVCCLLNAFGYGCKPPTLSERSYLSGFHHPCLRSIALRIKPESVKIWRSRRRYAREFFVRRSASECAEFMSTLHNIVRRKSQRLSRHRAALAEEKAAESSPKEEAAQRALMEEAAEKLQVTNLGYTPTGEGGMHE